MGYMPASASKFFLALRSLCVFHLCNRRSSNAAFCFEHRLKFVKAITRKIACRLIFRRAYCAFRNRLQPWLWRGQLFSASLVLRQAHEGQRSRKVGEASFCHDNCFAVFNSISLSSVIKSVSAPPNLSLRTKLEFKCTCSFGQNSFIGSNLSIMSLSSCAI